jgi:hypothetical protein
MPDAHLRPAVKIQHRKSASPAARAASGPSAANRTAAAVAAVRACDARLSKKLTSVLGHVRTHLHRFASMLWISKRTKNEDVLAAYDPGCDAHDVEQLSYEVNTFLNASSLMDRIYKS